jgi:hypothetical protein
MKKIAFALLAVAAVWALYKLKYPTYTWRYRITVQVDAGGEIRTGSSVVEVNAALEPRLLPEMRGLDSWARGQAVYVELPGKMNVVALLASGPAGENSDYPLGLAQRVFKSKIEDLPSLSGRRQLATDQMPTLITVANPIDAASIRIIKPDELDSLMGVHLRSVSIELTKDRITDIDIDDRLPFVTDEEKKRLEIIRPNVFSPRASIFVRR